GNNESMSRILIFVNNKKFADMVHDRIADEFPGHLGIIHSNKSQNYRLETMESFRQGSLRGIITTDIMARGLDIPDITHVINFDVSEVPEQYIHRIGRTGRADKDGIAISFVGPKEEDFFIESELLMDKEVDAEPIPEGVEISAVLIESEKARQPVKLLMKKTAKGNGAFQEKSEKNKKVNLGGPGKTKPRKTKSRNRGVERTRDKKRKDKGK
ncbi:MAG TPA: helicase-related protein, partial [Flavobacterium sp.]|nr:helicase-related protein [Flavobacterium sp.]